MPNYSLTLFQTGTHPGASNPSQNSIQGLYNSGGTTTFTGSPMTITVTDDDNLVEDQPNVASGPQSPETGSNAVLTNAETIFGSSFGAGATVHAIAQVEVNNLTSGDTGFAQIVQINSSNLNGTFLAFPYQVDPNDQLEFIPTDNNPFDEDSYASTQNYSYDQLTQGNVCYTSDTLIETKRGLVMVQELQQGDLIATKDNGFQPLAWKYERAMTRDWFRQNPHMAPVTLRAGALGTKGDVTFSPGHMLLVQDQLVAAKHFCAGDMAFRDTSRDLSYFHLLFEDHQLLQTQGMWSESFMPSLASLSTLGRNRAEIFEIFPELGTYEGLGAYQPVRKQLYRKKAKAAVSAII